MWEKSVWAHHWGGLIFSSRSQTGCDGGRAVSTHESHSCNDLLSKISPAYPWKIPRTLQQQFLKEFLSMYGKVWGYFPRVCGQNHQFLHLIFGLIRSIGILDPGPQTEWQAGMEKNHVMIWNILSLKIMEDPNVYYVRFINILILICSHVTSATFRFDEGNTLDELARSSKRASRFPEKCGRLPTPAYKKRCLAKDVPGGARINQNFQSAKVTVGYIIG